MNLEGLFRELWLVSLLASAVAGAWFSPLSRSGPLQFRSWSTNILVLAFVILMSYLWRMNHSFSVITMVGTAIMMHYQWAESIFSLILWPKDHIRERTGWLNLEIVTKGPCSQRSFDLDNLLFHFLPQNVFSLFLELRTSV